MPISTEKQKKQKTADGKNNGKIAINKKKKDGTTMELSSMEKKGWKDFEN